MDKIFFFHDFIFLILFLVRLTVCSGLQLEMYAPTFLASVKDGETVTHGGYKVSLANLRIAKNKETKRLYLDYEVKELDCTIDITTLVGSGRKGALASDAHCVMWSQMGPIPAARAGAGAAS